MCICLPGVLIVLSGKMLCTLALAWRPLPKAQPTMEGTLMVPGMGGVFAGTTMATTMRANGVRAFAMDGECSFARIAPHMYAPYSLSCR
jgi:D-arabinose 1-dehydrogenase-like Zn-dependent alcohol dehydrogenase